MKKKLFAFMLIFLMLFCCGCAPDAIGVYEIQVYVDK